MAFTARLVSSKGARPVTEAIEQVLDQLAAATPCSDMMHALCHDRCAELAGLPVPAAVTLLRQGLETLMQTLISGSPAVRADALATVRHLLTCAPLRKAAAKASRLQSLSTAILHPIRTSCDLSSTDAAGCAVLRLLQDAGVCVASAGALEAGLTPLMAALQRSLCASAEILLEAGADVNERSRGDTLWPLYAAAIAGSDRSMQWLLARGASLAMRNSEGQTIAHALGMMGGAFCDSVEEENASFSRRWLRILIAREPRSLVASAAGGLTPLMLAARTGSEAGVATLLELGASVGSCTSTGNSALMMGCKAASLPVVRRLLGAGAADAAVLPPRSAYARALAWMALGAAVVAERGCGACAVRCRGSLQGNCANSLAILRAVLAAGVRGPIGPEGHALANTAVCYMTAFVHSERSSEGHVLKLLQTLRDGGVDMLIQGPSDKSPILHAAAAANAPDVVRWLTTVAGAPLEERDAEGLTPLLAACDRKAWAAAHALLDCGARVDVHTPDELRWWPVLHAAALADGEAGLSLLRRLLAADRDSLRRSGGSGSTAIHAAAAVNTGALKIILDSGLPHLAEALNTQLHSADAAGMTPLHLACGDSQWDAALALLRAGARVDISGWDVGTIKDWARNSGACLHRGLKAAIAARAKEHLSEAAFARAVKNTPKGAAAVAVTATSAAADLERTRGASASSGRAFAANTRTPAAGTAAAASEAATALSALPTASARPKKGAKPRKGGRRGAGRNVAEVADDDDGSEAPAGSVTVAASIADEPVPLAGAEATVATEAVRLAPSTCEEGASAAEVGGAALEPATHSPCAMAAMNLPETCPPTVSAFNLPEDLSAAAAAPAVPNAEAAAAEATAPVDGAATTGCGAPPSKSGGHTVAATVSAAVINTCEPGPRVAYEGNICEHSEAVTPVKAPASSP
jgi:26S proteasome non-ATPase regulatory subunit 10